MAFLRRMLLVLLVLLTGCSLFGSRDLDAPPRVLKGTNAQVQEELHKAIPVGTSRAEAGRIVKSLGLNPEDVPSGDESDSIMRCDFTGPSGLFAQTKWLIEIHFINDEVSDIICERIQISY